MEAITVDELIEKLKKFENKYIVVVLEGNIYEKISMEFAEVNKDEDFIELIYNKNKRDVFGKSLRINLHQIKNIESKSYEDLQKEANEAYVAAETRKTNLLQAYEDKKLKSKALIKEAKAIKKERDKINK